MYITTKDLGILKLLIPDKNIKKFQFIHKVGDTILAENRDFIINFTKVDADIVKKSTEVLGQELDFDYTSMFHIPVSAVFKSAAILKPLKLDKLGTSLLKLEKGKITQVISNKIVPYLGDFKEENNRWFSEIVIKYTPNFKKFRSMSSPSLVNLHRVTGFLNSLAIKKSDLDKVFLAFQEKKLYIKYINPDTKQMYQIQEK